MLLVPIRPKVQSPILLLLLFTIIDGSLCGSYRCCSNGSRPWQLSRGPLLQLGSAPSLDQCIRLTLLGGAHANQIVARLSARFFGTELHPGDAFLQVKFAIVAPEETTAGLVHLIHNKTNHGRLFRLGFGFLVKVVVLFDQFAKVLVPRWFVRSASTRNRKDIPIIGLVNHLLHFVSWGIRVLLLLLGLESFLGWSTFCLRHEIGYPFL
mmetsp:Transcript_11729/g.32485  ORF Transcript_11729/g.32485 Transcript_11729/m.32485 type:complete len:209 (-) Transcript_11729:799-1425(-)